MTSGPLLLLLADYSDDSGIVVGGEGKGQGGEGKESEGEGV